MYDCPPEIKQFIEEEAGDRSRRLQDGGNAPHSRLTKPLFKKADVRAKRKAQKAARRKNRG